MFNYITPPDPLHHVRDPLIRMLTVRRECSQCEQLLPAWQFDPIFDIDEARGKVIGSAFRYCIRCRCLSLHNPASQEEVDS